MTTIKISALPAVTGALSSTDVVAAVQSGTTVKATVDSFGYQPSGTNAVATTLQAKLRESITPNDFGAVGNGIANDTLALQAFLNAIAGKSGVILPGTYLVNSQLTIKSGTVLFMYGATLQASNSLPSNSLIMINEDTGLDTNIEIYGGSFIGNSDASRTNSLLAMLRVNKLKLYDIYFSTNSTILLQVAGCTDFILENLEATNYGKAAVSTEGGAAFYIGNYFATSTPCVKGQINNLYAHNGEWSGMYLVGVSGHNISEIIVNNFRAINVKEAAIFFVYANNCQINNVYINGVTKKNISANGIEIGEVYNFNIVGGTIQNIGASCITLANCQDGFIGGGLQTINAKRDGVSYVSVGHITFIINTFQRRITISNIKSYDSSLNSSGNYSEAAVQIGTTANPAAICNIKDNDFSGSAWASGDAIQIAAGSTAADTYHYNNAGAKDALPYRASFVLSASIGTQTITGIPFRPRHIEVTTTYVNGSNLYQSTSSIYFSAGASTNIIARDAAGQYGTTSNNFIELRNSSGTVQCQASFVSFDEFGFTLNVTTNTIQPSINAICYA